MIVRRWRDEDGAEPARIVRAVFDEYGFSWDEGDYCADLYNVRGHYLDRGHLFWVAEHEGAVIGTVALELFAPIGSGVRHLGSAGEKSLGSDDRPDSTHPHRPAPISAPEEASARPEGGTMLHEGKVRVTEADCSLERLYVHPEARGLGAGSALFQTTIDEARRRGRQVMEIWSDKKLENAHRLYGHFGAVVIGERICDDPDESPEWGLRLRL